MPLWDMLSIPRIAIGDMFSISPMRRAPRACSARSSSSSSSRACARTCATRRARTRTDDDGGGGGGGVVRALAFPPFRCTSGCGRAARSLGAPGVRRQGEESPTKVQAGPRRRLPGATSPAPSTA
eukprot:scaffold3043_cov360-Prasinococcus_capsulatus_cf.AAC.1